MMDCPFDVAIEEVDEKDESPLKISRQKSSDTIMQHEGFRTQNISRNGDQEVIQIKHLKRHSLIGNNTPRNEPYNFRPRIGQSDCLKPYKPEELIQINDPDQKS